MVPLPEDRPHWTRGRARALMFDPATGGWIDVTDPVEFTAADAVPTRAELLQRMDRAARALAVRRASAAVEAAAAVMRGIGAELAAVADAVKAIAPAARAVSGRSGRAAQRSPYGPPHRR